MRGHVRRRGDRWRAMYDLGPGSDPKTGEWRERRQRSKTFGRRGDAQAWLAKQVDRVSDGIRADAGAVTVGEYLEDWLGRVRGDMRESTWRWHRGRVNGQLVPTLGRLKLRDLAREHVQDLYASLTPELADRAHRTLRKALYDACASGLLARNPAARVRRGTQTTPKQRGVRVWEWDELARFFVVADEDELFAYWRLVASTGCRRGEGLGIFWTDVETQLVTFKRSRTDGGWELPKTRAGARTVDIDEQTAAALRRWRKRQNEQRLAAGPAWRDTILVRGQAVPNELVFTQLDGAPRSPNRVTMRFQELRRRAELPYIVLHDLRHTHATLLLKAGFNAKIVQERLGHKSVAITLDLYGHVLPSMGRDVAAHVARMLPADPGAEVKPLVRLEAARGIEPRYGDLQSPA